MLYLTTSRSVENGAMRKSQYIDIRMDLLDITAMLLGSANLAKGMRACGV